MRKAMAMMVILVAMFSVGCHSASATGSSNARVLHIGDSLTATAEWTAYDQYTSAGFESSIWARSGSYLSKPSPEDGFNWIPNISKLISWYHPNILVVELGSNDAGDFTNPLQYSAAVDQVMAMAGNIPVYWVSINSCTASQEWNTAGDALNWVLIAQASHRSNMHLINTKQVMCQHMDLSIDTVHFRPAGQVIYINTIIKAVAEYPVSIPEHGDCWVGYTPVCQ